MSSPLTFRWLGAAGIELTLDGCTLLVDPYLTRLSLREVLFGKAVCDTAVVFRHIGKADAILVTHSHFDHCMDVPAIARRFECPVFAGHNALILLEKQGVQPSSLQFVRPGDSVSYGPFHIEVAASSHRPLMFMRQRALHGDVQAPRRAFDYVHEGMLAFRITAGNTVFLTDPGASPAQHDTDVLFLNTLQKRPVIDTILSTVRSPAVLPIHWDNSFRKIPRSLSTPLWHIFPINSYSMKKLKKKVTSGASQRIFYVPELLRHYPAEEFVVPETRSCNCEKAP